MRLLDLTERLTADDTMAAIEGALALASDAPGLASMAVDIVDEQAGALRDRGVDVQARLGRAGVLLERLSDDRTMDGLEAALDLRRRAARSGVDGRRHRRRAGWRAPRRGHRPGRRSPMAPGRRSSSPRSSARARSTRSDLLASRLCRPSRSPSFRPLPRRSSNARSRDRGQGRPARPRPAPSATPMSSAPSTSSSASPVASAPPSKPVRRQRPSSTVRPRLSAPAPANPLILHGDLPEPPRSPDRRRRLGRHLGRLAACSRPTTRPRSPSSTRPTSTTTSRSGRSSAVASCPRRSPSGPRPASSRPARRGSRTRQRASTPRTTPSRPRRAARSPTTTSSSAPASRSTGTASRGSRRGSARTASAATTPTSTATTPGRRPSASPRSRAQ